MQRSSYTVETLKTIARLKSEFNGNLSKASKVLNISRKQLTDWQKNEVKMANMTNKKVKRHTGGRGVKYPLLEEQLFAWFKEQRESKYILQNTFDPCLWCVHIPNKH